MQKLTLPTLECYKTSTTPHKEEFLEICSDIEEHCGKRDKRLIWTLPYKTGFTNDKARRALAIAKERGVNDVRYIIGILKKL